MNIDSLDSLLGSSNIPNTYQDVPTSTMCSLPAFQHMFIMQEDYDKLKYDLSDTRDQSLANIIREKTKFDYGININFMAELQKLSTTRAILFTFGGSKQPIHMAPTTPMTIYNTGNKGLRRGTSVTVCPPLTRHTGAVRYGADVYPLATVNRETFRREINELVLQLRTVNEVDASVNSEAVKQSHAYRYMRAQTLSNALAHNSMWQEMVRAVKETTKEPGNKIKTVDVIADIALCRWSRFLGSSVGDQALPYVFRSPFMIAGEMVHDLAQAVAATDPQANLQPLLDQLDDLPKLSSPELEDGSAPSVKAFEKLMRDTQSVFNTLIQLTASVRLYEPIEHCRIHSSASLIIPPGGSMQVVVRN